ncbi:hypothetical protein A2917_02685 [Candidatus Nomurabacteria bacterium RIFCSPLOWO2_01_FULL_42_17]|uniref:DUF1003 domain-containing protein n=1 Tax=Candidatus Nomurabacteria bacterium RIFCSPLOWO2_01_FULL_42_17 TaxID=1801780 RepID=A0A1F6XMU0_9BACT|nr:MAG: hypothetical protein A2917_02685 [Candidatus Nomurabacteria bacterium RIFCSPLOWO2_01_FULL_42_17]
MLKNSQKNQRGRMFQSIKAEANFKRTGAERMADWITSRIGSMPFLLTNVIFFTLWILINTGQIRLIPPFDPFPFNLLTTFVSLEAIFLAIFVLISQNRSSKVDDLREETHLQLNLISEKEVTKLMKMISLLMEKEGIDMSQDPELKEMLRPFSEEDIERRLEKEIF